MKRSKSVHKKWTFHKLWRIPSIQNWRKSMYFVVLGERKTWENQLFNIS